MTTSRTRQVFSALVVGTLLAISILDLKTYSNSEDLTTNSSTAILSAPERRKPPFQAKLFQTKQKLRRAHSNHRNMPSTEIDIQSPDIDSRSTGVNLLPKEKNNSHITHGRLPKPQTLQFDCIPKEDGDNLSCNLGISFYKKSEILNGLRSKWLLFLGDSCTRSMVLALTNMLDLQNTGPFDFKTWYNVTDPAEGRQYNWRGLGGYFFRLDYIFKENPEGGWRIVYKKASQVNLFERSDRPQATHLPKVFLQKSVVNSDEVRISFYNVRDSEEVRKVWKLFPGTPDIVYANVGAWNSIHDNKKGRWRWKCNTDIFQEIKSVSKLVWGSLQQKHISACDSRMFRLRDVLTLDRSLVPNTELGQRTQLGDRTSSVHYAHIVNIIDVMRLFTLLGWHENRRTVEFSKLCVAVGDKDELLEQGIQVHGPDQGWKTAWALPCRFEITGS